MTVPMEGRELRVSEDRVAFEQQAIHRLRIQDGHIEGLETVVDDPDRFLLTPMIILLLTRQVLDQRRDADDRFRLHKQTTQRIDEAITTDLYIPTGTTLKP